MHLAMFYERHDQTDILSKSRDRITGKYWQLALELPLL
jgi:hypothetical protein